jgi:myo-inositol catabolism protein IolC
MNLMSRTSHANLFMLAFDQRGSFTTGLFDIKGTPTSEETARIADAKRVIFEGLNLAVLEGAPMANAGLLVDEQFGAEVARAAKASGYTLAMPVEKSGQNEFDFEYGADYGQHIETFDPDYAKVLVRYNPDGDSALNVRQLNRLATLSGWLRDHDRRLLFELLVPAEPLQLEKLGGDCDVYDLEMRPELTIRAIAEAQAAGVEPDIWKVEGLDRREDYERVAEQARTAGREGVACIILGRGADDAKLENWLRQEAGVPGFIGFAIGRTIWQRPLRELLAQKLDRAGASRVIADNYRRMVGIYLDASSGSGSP